MFLDRLQFRKLDNGYTVKYHVADDGRPAGVDANASGFVKESYFADLDGLIDFVETVMRRYIEPGLGD